MEGVIVKIQRFSVQDGLGIRTTVFLKGCPLRCLWCSNPETQNSAIELEYDRAKCLPHCYECVSVCRNEAIAKEGEYIIINRQKCTACMQCVKACYRKALIIIGRKMDTVKIVDEVERDKPFYEKSAGGVTLSGGEPLYQPEFTKQIAKECKQRSISTALDTTGYVNWKILNDVLKYIDLVLYDIKYIDPEKHKKFTGVSNYLILENAKRISKEGIPIILRIPIIPGVNDNLKDLSLLAEFANNLPYILGVHLLPYHRIGVVKYHKLGREYSMTNLQQPTKEYILKISKILKSYGIEPVIVS